MFLFKSITTCVKMTSGITLTTVPDTEVFGHAVASPEVCWIIALMTGQCNHGNQTTGHCLIKKFKYYYTAKMLYFHTIWTITSLRSS